ncbi:MAG: hypothetical protein LLF78_07050 [Synergistaceae bacterium]|nr:hypothetical protein [Synergistaceae bacterium]
MSGLTRFLSKCCMHIKKVYRVYRTEVILRKYEKEIGLQIPRLTPGQKKEIDALYAKHGFNVVDKYYRWHHLLYATTGIKSPYFVDIYLRNQIVARFNNIGLSDGWDDKSYYDLFCKGVKMPHTVLRNINGMFYDHDFQLITPRIAADILHNEEKVIVKPSINSSGGHNVRLYEKNVDADKIFSIYGRNFVVQRVVRQHPILSAFNMTSVNTIRIMSWYFDGEVNIFASILRIGKEGSVVDNLSSGGIGFKIGYDGTVRPGGYDGHGRLIHNCKSDVAEKDVITIPAYSKIVDTIKKLHPRFPHFGIIAWDFTVDRDSEPVLIEYNLKNPGINIQFCTGPFFGEMSERILEEAGKRDIA